MFQVVNNAVRKQCIKLLRCHKQSSLAISVRHNTYESDGKTTMKVLNKEMDSLMVDSYSQVGFRLNNGLYVLGPMAIFPRTVLSWNVAYVEEINEDSLSLFSILEPKPDILVLGVGESTGSQIVNKQVLSFMVKQKINVEILTTDQACATFNFLNSENRFVVGAMIPPGSFRPTENDVLLTKLKTRKLSLSLED